jgi:hypothetical protein
MKRNIIRGVRIEREPSKPPGGTVEYLRYTIDVYDERENLVEVLGRLADLDPARAAFKACCAKYPDKRIFLREGARTLGRYDELK